MIRYNAIATLDRKHDGSLVAEQVHNSDLTAYHAVTATDERGRVQIIITITAENLSQAVITARAVLAQFADKVRIDLMTADEYTTVGLTQIPEGPTPDRAVVTHGPDFDPVRLEIMTTKEYERDDVPIPALVSVTQAAKVLGISRQAVLSRINNGTLAHAIVGQSYAIPASAVSSSGSSTPTSISEKVSVARATIAKGATP